jgi:hypothetical protein
MGQSRSNSSQHILWVMTFRFWILNFEYDKLTRLAFLAFWKWWEPKNDNGHQRQAASRDWIPSLRRVYWWRNLDPLPKSTQISCVLLDLSLQMNQQGLPRERKVSERRIPRKTLSSRNRRGDPINSTRRLECLTNNDCRKVVDFAWDGSHAYVANRLRFQGFTLDFPRVDKRTEISSFDDVFAIDFQAPRTCAQQLAISCHRGRKMVLLWICSRPNMNSKGWKHTGSGE